MKEMKRMQLISGVALRHAFLSLMFLVPGLMKAQLHEEISVEGKYVPEVIKVEKINTFPKTVSFRMAGSPLAYEKEGVATSFRPVLMPLPPTGWRADRKVSDRKGYLEFGAGSWLNSTLSAGYRFVKTPEAVFGVRLQHNSTSLWKPSLSEGASGVRQWRYDEAVGVYGGYSFRGLGRLEAAVDYHLGMFDYYAFFDGLSASMENLNAPTQTLNDLSVRLAWKSEMKPEPSLSYYAGGAVRHFAYRALPGGVAAMARKGARETDIELNGGVRLPWDNGSSIGMDARGDILLYSVADVGKYGVATLTPYYRFTRGLLDVKLGADIDVAVRAGMSGNRYPAFHFAPDVRFALQTGQIGIYLDALGGTALNTLSSLHELDYYGMPTLLTTRPVYTPLDARFGVNLGPFSGFSLGVSGGYRISRSVPLGGWYMAMLDYGTSPIPGIDLGSHGDVRMLYARDTEGINLHGLSVGASMEYKPVEFLSLKGDISYQPQKGEKGYFNGYDRARITSLSSVTVSPLAPLRLTLSYDYRGVRTIYTRYTQSLPSVSINGAGPDAIASLRLPDLCRLNFGASWDFNPDFSIWLQGDNLLDRHDWILPLQPSQGIIVTAGLKLLF